MASGDWPGIRVRRCFRNVVLVSLLAGLAGCDGGGRPAGSPDADLDEVATTVSIAGGTIAGPDGVQVIVPPGALAAPVTIRVRRTAVGAPAQPGSYRWQGQVYEITPHGQVFQAPVTIRLPIGTGVADDEVRPFRAGEGDESWWPIEATPAGDYVEWQTLTFSWFVLGVCAPKAGDPLPCAWSRIAPQLTSVPDAAASLDLDRPDTKVWTITDNANLSVDLSIRAPADCGQGGSPGRLQIWEVSRVSPAQNALVLDTPVALVPDTLPQYVRGTVSWSPSLSHLDNPGRSFVVQFRCTRAFDGITSSVAGTAHFRIQIPATSAPGFATGPASTTVAAPATAAFTAVAYGTPAPTLQWQRSIDNGATWSNLNGATAATYTTPATSLALNGTRYRVVATNAVGSAISDAATLTVITGLPPPQPFLATCPVAPEGYAEITRLDWQAGDSGLLRNFQVACSRNGSCMAVWTRTASNGAQAELDGLYTARWTAGGGWSDVIRHADSTGDYPRIAMDDQGTTQLLWWRSTDRNVLTRRYRTGSGWSTTTPIAAPPVWDTHVDLRIAGNGAGVLAHPDPGRRSVVSRSLAGDEWSAPTTVFDSEAAIRQVQAVVDAAGRATALWYTNGGVVYAATSDENGQWSSSVVLATDDAGGGVHEAPHLALGVDGTAWAAWIWLTASNEYRLQVRRRPPGGEWTPVEDGPVDNQFLDSLVIGAGPAGRMTAAYYGYSLVNGNYPGHIYAREFQVGSGWRPQTQLTDQMDGYDSIRLVVDTGGNATAVWRGADNCCEGVLLSRSYATGLGWSELRTIREYDERINDWYLVATGNGPAVLALNERLTGWTGERLGTVACLEGVTGGNSPPTADPGSHQLVLAGDTVRLNGSASHDAEGNGLAYAWTLSTRPGGSSATLDDSMSATPSFLADLPGLYEVQLVVNDGIQDSVPATVTVRALVLTYDEDANKAPLAAAGSARKALVGSTVDFDAGGSFDPDGDALTYAWTMAAAPAGSVAVISQADQQQAAFVPDIPGNYRIDLVVSDGQLASTPSSFFIAAMAFNSRIAVTSQYPAPGAAFVPASLRITAGFSAELDPASINQDVFSVVGPEGALPGVLSVVGATIIFIPEQTLDPDSTYTVTALRQITALDGRVLGTDVAWSFFTGLPSDVDRPRVVRVQPADGARGVLPLQPGAIAVEFDEAMDPGSLATGFRVAVQDGGPVPGYVQMLADNRAVFVPQPAQGQSLDDQTWIATLTADVQDEAGNAIERSVSWSFRTLPAHSPAWLSRPGTGSAAMTASYYANLPIRHRCLWTYKWECFGSGGPPRFMDFLWDLGWDPTDEPRAVFFNGDDLASGRNARCFVSTTPVEVPGMGLPVENPFHLPGASANASPGATQVACYVGNHGPIPGSAGHPDVEASLADAVAQRDATSITAIFSRYSDPRSYSVARVRESPGQAYMGDPLLQIGDIVTIGPATGTIAPGHLFYPTSTPAGVGQPCSTDGFFQTGECPMEGEPLYGLLVLTPRIRVLGDESPPVSGWRYVGSQQLTFKVLGRGNLVFQINDNLPRNAPDDQPGSYVVPIVVERANAVSFMVYAPDSNGEYRLTGTAALDSEGPKRVPHACIACHGGEWDPETATVTGSSLLPFDPARMTFPSDPGWRREDQEPALNQLNRMVYLSQSSRSLLTLPITEWLAGTYGGAPWPIAAAANDQYVPPGWAGDATLYREVVKPYCQSCHQALRPSLDFSTASQFRGLEASIRGAVCVARSMPHAGATFIGFWKSNAPQVLRQFLFPDQSCP